MTKRVDEGALLDKLGVPPGTPDERQRWLFDRVAHASTPDERDHWLSRVHEYVNATTDPDACSRCYHKKAEGYFEGGRFVREFISAGCSFLVVAAGPAVGSWATPDGVEIKASAGDDGDSIRR